MKKSGKLEKGLRKALYKAYFGFQKFSNSPIFPVENQIFGFKSCLVVFCLAITLVE